MGIKLYHFLKIFRFFENPRRGRQARNFTTNIPKILDLKIVFRTDIFRKLLLGAPDLTSAFSPFYGCKLSIITSVDEITFL